MKHSFTCYPLQKIFGAPSHIAILRVLNQLTQGISGRELARRAGINDRTCRLALKRLENLNLVENLGSGKTKLFRLNRKNYFTETIFSSFYSKENDYLSTVIEKLRAFFQNNCEWACIYGSVVKKTDSESSDLDILIVVTNEKDVETLQDKMIDLTTGVFTDFGLSLSPVILTVKQWNEDRQFRDFRDGIHQDHIHLAGKRI